MTLLVFIVLVGEADLPILECFQSVIGDGDAMGIAAQIIEDPIRTAEWRLGVDYPFTVMEWRQIPGEAFGIRQFLQFAVELQFACRVGLLQISKVEFPETTRQNFHGQEEAWTAGHPTAAVQGDSATGHDTMQMGMKVERLPPRVQDAEKADLRAQMLGISAIDCKVSAVARNNRSYISRLFWRASAAVPWQRKHYMKIFALAEFACRFSSHLALLKTDLAVYITATTGHSSAATRAARRRRFYEASSRVASGAGSSRLLGSTTCSPAYQRTPSPDSANCFLTTGNRLPHLLRLEHSSVTQIRTRGTGD